MTKRRLLLSVSLAAIFALPSSFTLRTAEGDQTRRLRATFGFAREYGPLLP